MSLQDYMQNKLTLEGGQHFKPAPAGVGVKIYQSDGEALTDLALGDGTRLDAVLTGMQMARNAINGGLPLKILGDPLLYSPSCLAFDNRSPLDSKSLVAAISTIVDAMHTDGTMTGLSRKYLGGDFTTKK